KSDEENADAPITKDQLKLYALGHRELTGETANYIMTYVIGKNQPKTPEKLYDDDLEQIQQKIKDAVGLIRDEKFVRTDQGKACSENCYQIRLCRDRKSTRLNSSHVKT